jgi:lysyl-tRNA synthetase class 2
MNDSPSDSDLLALRRAHLAALRARGNAYPNDFRRTAFAAELLAKYGGADAAVLEHNPVQVRVAGRMMSRRTMGKAAFAHLQDMSGRIQLYLKKDKLPDGLYEDFAKWDIGDIAGAEGTLFRTRTGELSVQVSDARLLAKSLRPLPEKFHGLTDQETRYRQRYLDLLMSEETRRVFTIRARIIEFIRTYLSGRGFLEVETPMMHAIPGGALARPFVTHHNALDMELYLRVAPELYLKRLVVGGLERVFEINRSFRNEGLSTKHNPEFTMLEFYWAFADYRDLLELTEDMLRGMARAVHDSGAGFRFQERDYDLSKPFRRLTVREAIVEFNAGVVAENFSSVERLRETAARLDVKIEPGHGPGKIEIEIFEKTVEPKLLDPTFITAYPTEVSPLSRRNDADPSIADRFELFIAGREIANGFSELNDPDDQAERFRQQVANKDAGDREAMHFDQDYVTALEYGLPPTAGEGIGIDRLTMLLTDSSSIRDVILFPHLRPKE